MNELTIDSVLAWMHFLALFFTFASLFAELVLCLAEQLNWQQLNRIDLGYFVAAMMVLLTGFGRVFFGLKGAHYYFHDPMFYALLVTFLLVGLLSILPTIVFIHGKKATENAPDGGLQVLQIKMARICLMAELSLFCIAPVFAVLMANGVGY
jgi:putative membrane protein